jgi:hypothetical protein
MYVKPSNVYTFAEVECACGAREGPCTNPRMRWFKVDGRQTCEDCIRDYIQYLTEMLMED